MEIAPGRRTLPFVIAGLASIVGVVAALHYARLGLTLSHYDARGHLVVARRIFDSLTPGWQQIGAVWLPLPHLLNMLPVQVDAFYRTGASGVAISILSFAVAAGATAWIVLTLTGSAAAAVAGAAVFGFNPNVLYLQSTPMTEPLLLALTTLSVALLIAWCANPPGLADPPGGVDPQVGVVSGFSRTTPVVGVVLALACLTRYEAWPVVACALAGAVWARWRQGDSLFAAARRVAAVAVYPAAAIAGFMVFSRVVIGQWFVSGGFFVPENKALGRPVLSAAEIWWGTHMLSSYALVAIAATGLLALVVRAAIGRGHAAGVVAVSLTATAAVPWVAFLDGHPFRVRYMVPLLAVEAVGVGIAWGGVRRALATVTPHAEVVVMAAGLLLVGYETRPLDANAPMVIEAQWDRPNVKAREAVTACLRDRTPGTKIMASMGSLGHYMQETAREGFAIRDFLHEGNGDIWLAALDEGPRRFVDWVLIEEKAEGGDMLAARVREQPRFLDGFTRACEGAGLALYKRTVVLSPKP